jgi:protein phosphatase
MLDIYEAKQADADRFVKSYQRYCWPVNSLENYKLAPFHILATEGKQHTSQNHEWHMEEIKRICAFEPVIMVATPYRTVNLNDAESVQQATDWWLSLTATGGEGMVVKPFDFITSNKKGVIQPAIKIRGREYLRIIYGPEYTEMQNLNRLKARGLAAKRGLALREFALGVEGLERFTAQEPLRRVHQCVFGVMAMESEPVDPRL